MLVVVLNKLSNRDLSVGGSCSGSALSADKCQRLLPRWMAVFEQVRLPVQHCGSVLDLLPFSKFFWSTLCIFFFVKSELHMMHCHKQTTSCWNKYAEQRPRTTTKLAPERIICSKQNTFFSAAPPPTCNTHYWYKSETPDSLTREVLLRQ